MHYKARS